MTPGKRYSKQREMILQTVKNSTAHPTAEMVYESVREEIPKVSLGTVYRNLNLLTSEGEIRELVLEDDAKRYDGNLGEHYHCICQNCGEITDVYFDSRDLINELKSQISGFQIEDQKVEFYGLCKSCAIENQQNSTP